MFEEDKLIALAQYGPGTTTSPEVNWYAALSIVSALALRIMSGMRNDQSEDFLQTTIKILPHIITEEPDDIAIGVCLSTVCNPPKSWLGSCVADHERSFI